MNTLIIDSWAVLAFLHKEPSCHAVKDVLQQAKQRKIRILMSLYNVAEVYYKLIRTAGIDEARKTIESLRNIPIDFTSLDEQRIFHAAEIKGKYPVAFGDCIAVALAQEHTAPILTGDPEYRRIEHLVSIRWL